MTVTEEPLVDVGSVEAAAVVTELDQEGEHVRAAGRG